MAMRVLGLFCCLGVSLAAAPLGAQFVVDAPAVQRSVRLGVERPFYVGDDFGGRSAVLRASVVAPLRENVTFTGGLSLSHATVDARPASATLSNVMLALHFGRDEDYVTLAVGLPLARALTDAGYAAESGFITDLERPEVFVPDVLSIALQYNPRWRLDSGTVVGARGGAVVVTPSGLDAELYARYGAFAERRFGRARVGGELTGSTLLSGDGGGFGAMSVNQFTVFAGLPGSATQPHVFLRLPIENDTQRVLNAVVGVRLSF